MSTKISLADKVQQKVGNVAEPLVTPSMLEAIRLADMFDGIKPDAYLLPLDAMTGFKAATKVEAE